MEPKVQKKEESKTDLKTQKQGEAKAGVTSRAKQENSEEIKPQSKGVSSFLYVAVYILFVNLI